MKSFLEMDPLERSREFTKQSMEPWKEEFIPSRKITLLIPLKLPSGNKILGRNRFELYAHRNTWHEAVTLAISTQPSSEQVRYFRERLGAEGITYIVTVTARLFRKYDGDNPFPKWCIDGLKGELIKDDSLKHIGKPDIRQELIPYAKRVSVPNFGRGKRPAKKITKYYDSTGKQLYPETIIEIEMVERQEVLL